MLYSEIKAQLALVISLDNFTVFLMLRQHGGN